MPFPSEKGRFFSLHKSYPACVTISSSTSYGCTCRIGVFWSVGRKFLAVPVLWRQRFSMCKRFAVVSAQNAICLSESLAYKVERLLDFVGCGSPVGADVARVGQQGEVDVRAGVLLVVSH